MAPLISAILVIYNKVVFTGGTSTTTTARAGGDLDTDDLAGARRSPGTTHRYLR